MHTCQARCLIAYPDAESHQSIEQQNTLLFFCFQRSIPSSDHASSRLSREAKRLDSRERRGTLPHASLKTFLCLSCFLIFSLLLNWSTLRLDIEGLFQKPT